MQGITSRPPRRARVKVSVEDSHASGCFIESASSIGFAKKAVVYMVDGVNKKSSTYEYDQTERKKCGIYVYGRAAKIGTSHPLSLDTVVFYLRVHVITHTKEKYACSYWAPTSSLEHGS